MVTNKKTALKYILRSNGKFDAGLQGKKTWETAIKILETESVENGLSTEEIEDVVSFITKTKLGSSYVQRLLKVLVPATTVTDETIQTSLVWLFSTPLVNAVLKQYIKWLTGILYYKLTNPEVVQNYYFSFMVLMNTNHNLIPVVCPLLCLLTKPCDVRRFTVKLILNIERENNNKCQIMGLLSLMKSFRPDVVPENIKVTSVNYQSAIHTQLLAKFSTSAPTTLINDAQISWDAPTLYDNKSRNLSRLLPPVEDINFASSIRSVRKIQLKEFQTILELARNWSDVSLPAQILSLLTNSTGHCIIAFSDKIVQSRLAYVLYSTLHRVFVLNEGCYTEHEKCHFLNQVYEFQEHIQQGLGVVSRFLHQYLIIWDTYTLQDQILALCEWNVFFNAEMANWFLPAMRQAFRSNNIAVQCKIIRTLTRMLMNLTIHQTRITRQIPQVYLEDADEDIDVYRVIGQLSTFVCELLTEGCNFSHQVDSKCLMFVGLDYFETLWLIEKKFDLPFLISLPPVLVYGCLLSGSRVLISRLCQQFNRYFLSVERLRDAQVNLLPREENKLEVYVLDTYRCLFASMDYLSHLPSYLFHTEDFSQLMFRFNQSFGNVGQIFNVENQIAFIDHQTITGSRINKSAEMLLNEYPEIKQFKMTMDVKLGRPIID